ncbi:hypothetical protein M1555_05315 [Patescibacteria group bacterium]|nr:hypothetical protein [Patescibacteria group bacterium]
MPKKKYHPSGKKSAPARAKRPAKTGLWPKLMAAVGITVLALLLSSQIPVTENLQTGGVVLGDERDAGESGMQQSISQPPQLPPSQKVGGQAVTGVMPQAQQAQTVSARGESRPNETETQGQGGTTLQTNVEDNGGVQFHFQAQNGEVQLEAQDAGGNTLKTRTQERERTRLEQELQDKGIDVSSSDGELMIHKANVGAVSHFPLSVDPLTNSLVVTTPAGQKTVTVLPDAAVQNLLSRGIMPVASGSATMSGTTAGGTPPSPIALTLHNNELVYQVEAQQQHRLFGFIPVTMPTTAYVSAENGQVVSETNSLLSQLVGLLSF